MVHSLAATRPSEHPHYGLKLLSPYEFLKKNPQYGATPEQALKAAAWGYESMVGYGADPNPGTNDPDHTTYPEETKPPKDMNTIGNNKVQLDGSVATWDQGGKGSRFLNRFPGANAVSKVHDIVTDVFTSSFSNAVTVLPSMALTYMALLPAPLVVELSVKPRY
ncbi:MAG: hypothetical protein ABL858_03145 [Candidatus Nitrotoga sp.]